MPEYLDNPRRVPRDQVRCRANIALGAEAIETTTEDIGSRGCQVILPAALQRGTMLGLTLQAPRLSAPLCIQGRVAWVSPQPPWRVGIAYAAGGLTDAARWMETFRQTSPELFVREKRPQQERIAVDAMCFLGVAPKLADFNEDELAVLRTIGSGMRVGELRTALSRSWPRMQRAFFALFARGFVTLSRAASAHPVTWKAILGAPPAPPAPGVTVVGDELVLESLLERSVASSSESSPPDTPPRSGGSEPRRGTPATPGPPLSRRATSPTFTPPPLPSSRPTGPAMPVVKTVTTPPAVPPPLPAAAASQRAITSPALDVGRRVGSPDFQGAGVGWRNGARGPRSPDAEAVFQLGLVELEAKHAQQALALFRRAISLAPGDPEIAHAIGRAVQGG